MTLVHPGGLGECVESLKQNTKLRTDSYTDGTDFNSPEILQPSLAEEILRADEHNENSW